MEYITQNWFNVVGLLLIAVGAIFAAKKYMDKDKAQKIIAIKEWLKYGVTVTERALGEKTGKLKLQMVWGLATAQFPFITKVMSFEQFSSDVDEALEWMKTQLETNPNIRAAVIGTMEEAQ